MRSIKSSRDFCQVNNNMNNRYDENGRNRFYVTNDVVHMDVFNLCDVPEPDVLFDKCFLEQVISRTWRQIAKAGGVYISTAGKKNESTRHITLHRYIMQLAGHNIDGVEIDHINGNPFDNRLANLRIVSHKKQMFNLAPSYRNKYGIRGVTDGGEYNKPFRVFFNYNHHRINVKTFKTLPEAAYMRYLLELHYYDDIAVQRHVASLKQQFELLSQTKKNELEQYAEAIFKRHPKEIVV